MNIEQGLLAKTQANHRGRRRYVDRPHAHIDHDTWNHSPKKLPRASEVKLGDLHGILPFNGVRNPSSRSNTSQKVFFPYGTPATGYKHRIGIAESAAEAIVGFEAIICPTVYDVTFQPLTVQFRDEKGKSRSYTHDILITFRNGHCRLVFVRNEASLIKPRTQRDIRAIAASTPPHVADDMIVVNANDYGRQRRDNMMRMHYFVTHPDVEADEELRRVAESGQPFYYMKDLFPHASVAAPRAFAACYRLIAQDVLRANLDHVLWENSRIEVPA
jgi:TnsA endonuclease-like protein|tara:strand:- start:7566 stop:8384 length:819 start_codon:yes stop_codon:yes gene_type:complete